MHAPLRCNTVQRDWHLRVAERKDDAAVATLGRVRHGGEDEFVCVDVLRREMRALHHLVAREGLQRVILRQTVARCAATWFTMLAQRTPADAHLAATRSTLSGTQRASAHLACNLEHSVTRAQCTTRRWCARVL